MSLPATIRLEFFSHSQSAREPPATPLSTDATHPMSLFRSALELPALEPIVVPGEKRWEEDREAQELACEAKEVRLVRRRPESHL